MNGCVKLFVNWRYDAITPSVIPPTPATERKPPRTAVSTNCKLPIFPITGPIIFANLFAWEALLNNASFSSSNSCSEIRSWLNTLTTRCPFIRSSTNPVTSASEFCCFTKYFPLFPPIFPVTFIIIPITTNARTVRIGLNTSMEMKVTMIVNRDINACGIAWLIICLNASVSFV